jgi:hypothetical protein
MIIVEIIFGEFIKISKIKTGNFILKLYSIINLAGKRQKKLFFLYPRT